MMELFKKVDPKILGTFRMSLSGQVGIEVVDSSTGQKAWRYYKDGKFIDITDMSFPLPAMMNSFYFFVPCITLKDGDILYMNNELYACEIQNGVTKFISYVTGESKDIKPIVMEWFKKPCYTKLINLFDKKKGGRSGMAKMLLMTSMMSGSNTSNSPNGTGGMMQSLMMMKMMGEDSLDFEGLLDGISDFDIDDEDMTTDDKVNTTTKENK